MRGIGTAVARHPVALWGAFVLVHSWLGWLNLFAPGLPLGDVTIVYRFWADQVLYADYWVGIHSAWVYPVVALFPMLASAAFGQEQYAATWLGLVTLLNAAGFAAIIGFRREARHRAAGWWWLGFMLLLGPIALGRIDTVTVPVAIVGVMLVARHPFIATAVLTIAAWVKVWPAAVVGAMIIALRERWRVLTTALALSAAIIATALSFGSGANVLSFVTQQTGRGLQVEAPISTWWLWRIVAGDDATRVYYDQQILTWQVSGDGVDFVAALMTPLLVLAATALIGCGVAAVRRGVDGAQLLAPLSLAFVTALIAFNKVGSPQFISWLAVPIVFGLVRATRGGRSFAAPAMLVAIIALLTQFVYPYLYGWLLAVHPAMVALLTVRNILLFVLLAWAVDELRHLTPSRAPQKLIGSTA